jgi:hypothetical protein
MRNHVDYISPFLALSYLYKESTVCPSIVLSSKESQAHLVDDVMMRRKTLFIMIFRAFMVFTLRPICRLETF